MLCSRFRLVGCGLASGSARGECLTVCISPAHGLTADGQVGMETSALLLKLHTADGYVDDGKPASDLGYMYKVCDVVCALANATHDIPPAAVSQMHVPVHQNRSIQTKGTLYSANNTVLFEFVVRAVRYRLVPLPLRFVPQWPVFVTARLRPLWQQHLADVQQQWPWPQPVRP